MEEAEARSREPEVGSQNGTNPKSRSLAMLGMTDRGGDGKDVGKTGDKNRGKKGVSLRKLEANRKNARLSTGPRTLQGKNVAKLNALKHGLLAEAIFEGAGETGEDARQFGALLEEVREDLRPNGAMERLLVEKIAVCYWRLRRVLRAEMGEIRQSFSGLAKELRGRRSFAQVCGQEPKTQEEEQRWTENELERLYLPQFKAAENILRYETSLERQLNRALFQLERIQRRKDGEAVPPPVMVDQSN